MTTLLLDATPVVGVQRPRVLHVPPSVASTGAEAVELAQMAGLFLDPWQQLVLSYALGEREDGKWAAFEVGLEVARQNGKGSVLEARELAGLFLLGERLIIHSAHQFDTSLEAFRRLLFLVESTPDFDRRVKRVSRSHGEEGIELKGGQRIRFRTRTKGGGRGFTADCLILDEAMYLPEAMHGALLPTLSAIPNPQVWYAGSAVDQEIHEHGIVFARARERGLRGDDPALAYFGFSAPGNHPDDVTEEMAVDPLVWAQANPGLGIRISGEHVAREYRSLDPRTFAVERLGVGDWPATDGSASSKITSAAWATCMDPESACLDPVCFVFDVSPDRSAAAICVAGWRSDGLPHVEVVESRTGTGWLPARLLTLLERHEALGVLFDNRGPAASLVSDLTDLGLVVGGSVVDLAKGARVAPVKADEMADACGMFFDAVDQQKIRHLGTTEMAHALRGAATRPLGDAWAWARKTSTSNITPLVGCTVAFWGLKSIVPAQRVNRSVVFL